MSQNPEREIPVTVKTSTLEVVLTVHTEPETTRVVMSRDDAVRYADALRQAADLMQEVVATLD